MKEILSIYVFSNKDINALIKIFLDKEITICGHVKYAYAVLNKQCPKEMIIINNYDSWFKQYLQFEYQKIDPVIIKSLSRVEGFYWGKDIISSPLLADEDIFLAGRDFSIDRGYTFVLHDNTDNLAVLSVFAGDNKIEDFQTIIDPNKANLQ